MAGLLLAAAKTLNESPSEKEGKSATREHDTESTRPSMKVPPKRKGNGRVHRENAGAGFPSMKVPPKRKGNGLEFATRFVVRMWALNESPSEKEGKYQHHQRQQGVC